MMRCLYEKHGLTLKKVPNTDRAFRFWWLWLNGTDEQEMSVLIDEIETLAEAMFLVLLPHNDVLVDQLKMRCATLFGCASLVDKLRCLFSSL